MSLAAQQDYVPLYCKSVYSFLEGASHPDELVEEAQRLGVRSLALTDRDGVYGIVRAFKAAQEYGVHLIVGSEITLQDDSSIVLLSQDRAGYANLCNLISTGRLRSPKGESRVQWDEVCDHAEGLIALWGGEKSSLTKEAVPDLIADQLKDAFGERLYALLTRHHAVHEQVLEHRLRERAKQYDIPTVAGMEVLYHMPSRRPLQDVLTCLRHGVTLATAGTCIHPNDEHALRSPYGFSRLYENDMPSIMRTNLIAEQCTFSLRELRYCYPMEKLPYGIDAKDWLRELVFQGAKKRYPELPQEVQDQLNTELDLIRGLAYEGYFLTMYEIVRYCNEMGILCQGRGSAANSAVCYCLGITAVDPIRMKLLFERFLSKERAEPPDIDLDIEHNRREEVIQHMYKKYGRSHAAMVANFIRYRAKSAVREVGKVLGIPETALERIARVLSHYEFPSQDSMKEAGFDPKNPTYANFFQLMTEIEDVPRHLSIHPGGFLLGDVPVSDLVPVENATMPDRTVIQWDKDDVEEMGLFKVDLLGLGALNVVHNSFDLLKEYHHEEWSMASIPPEDPATFSMIQKGDTVGVFQIESRGQMAMLPRLKPKNYYDLVIEVSIVRPGPITGGMVHPYLRRRNGEEKVDYPHECLRPVLEKTLGIPLFQEQVMQLAIVAADYTPGEADQLRRDMAAWKKTGRIERHRDRLISRMKQKGITEEFANRVFEQIKGFGDYGFPESHAASFALIAYATSWLKCHYPAAYLCAMLNAQPMGFYSPATLVDDSKRHKVVVRSVNVQHSEWDCTMEPVENNFAVRMGLRYVKGLHEKDTQSLLSDRVKNGPYKNMEAFRQRTQLSEAVLTRLAESGALSSFKYERREALWNVLGSDAAKENTLGLLDADPPSSLNPLNPFEEINWDYAFTSHSTRGHPLSPLRDAMRKLKLPDAATVRKMKHNSPVRYAGLVICRQRPGTAKGVVFMTLEDETGFVNLVLWESVFKEFALLAKTQSFLGVTGKMQVQSNVMHLVVKKLWIPDVDLEPHETQSRNFH
jgi:error-prone DNA polymerase